MSINFERLFFNTHEGKVAIASKDAEKASAVIIDDDNVTITSRNLVNGIQVGDNGITIQGDLYMTSKGKSIKKAEYTENPNSYKLFTHTETVMAESLVKEVAYKMAGSQGLDISSVIGDGKMPIITDPAPDGHIHTISMKHVHRVEPQYLYRIPGYIGMFKDFMKPFTEFINA